MMDHPKSVEQKVSSMMMGGEGSCKKLLSGAFRAPFLGLKPQAQSYCPFGA
jgi:hypothetical protein